MNRRYFLQSAVLGAAAVKPGQSASDKVTIAIMGIRGRGRALAGLFSSLPDVNIAFLCDVDPGVYDKAPKPSRRTIASGRRWSPMCAASSTTKASTRWWSRRRTIGTLRRPFWLVTQARTSTWKSPRRTTFAKGVS